VVLDLEAIDVDTNKMKILNGVVTDQLSGYEQLEIVAQADIRQMVDFEAEKQALGCDTNSCLSEIAGALGAGYVVFGRVGKLGEVIFIQLNLFDSAKGRAIAREEVRANDLAALPDKLRVAAARVVTPLTGEEPPPMPADTATTSSGSAEASSGGLAMPLMIAGGAVAGLGVAGATVAGVAAAVFDAQLAEAGKTGAERTELVTFGQTSVIVAGVSGAVALVGLGVLGASFVVE
jgi:ribosomal protein S28E/S33